MPTDPDIRLSIIVTTHNRADLLRRALGSIIALGAGVQIVLCADEGSEATRQVAASMLRPTDIFLCLPGYQGPAETRNAGIKFATAPFVSFLDDDDTVDEHLATNILPVLSDTEVTFCNYRKIFEEVVPGQLPVERRRVEKSTSRKPVSELMVRNFIPITAVFIPAAIARDVSFRPEINVSEDWDFLLQLYKISPFRHHDIFASNWHFLEDDAGSRNKKGKALRYSVTEMVYKLHPTADQGILNARASRLDDLRPKVRA